MKSTTHSLPPLPDSAVTEYAEGAAAAFEDTAIKHGIIRQYYLMNQFCIELQLCGKQVWDHIHPALAHAAIASPQPADLVISVWAGEQKPPSPLKWYRDNSSVAITHTDLPLYGPMFSTDAIRMAVNVNPNTLHLLDLSSNSGYVWIEDLSRYPMAWQAAPLFRVLSWWFATRDHVIAHASAVGTDEAGILIVGESGSGKSTSALACLGSEFGYMADDFCLVSNSEQPIITCLYNAAKLAGLTDFQRFPDLKRYVRNRRKLTSEKALLMIHEVDPALLRQQSPLKVIVYPNITDVPFPVFRRVSSRRMLPRMTVNSLRLQPSIARSMFHSLARISTYAVCYEMDIGEDVRQIPAGLRNLINDN